MEPHVIHMYKKCGIVAPWDRVIPRSARLVGLN